MTFETGITLSFTAAAIPIIEPGFQLVRSSLVGRAVPLLFRDHQRRGRGGDASRTERCLEAAIIRPKHVRRGTITDLESNVARRKRIGLLTALGIGRTGVHFRT